jgi:N-acetylglucosamine repressor
MKISGKPSLMKKINKNILLNLIREKGPISRAKLSKITKISRPTISNLIESLEKDNLIVERGIGDSKKVGKKPVLYEFNKNCGYVIGCQIRINEIETVVSNFNADILYENTTEIGEKRDSKSVMKKLFDNFENVIDKSSIDKNDIKGIGLGLSGIVDNKNGLLKYSSHFPEFGKDFEISRFIEAKFNIKTYIDNSARMMACAEKIFGSGRDYNNIVTIDTEEEAIGSGVIIWGNVYRGFDYLAGEIGHITVDPDGPECYCGNNGCAEKMISTKTLLKKIKSNFLRNKNSIIYKNFRDIPDKIALKDIFNAYIDGDDFVCSVFEEIEDWFSIIIGNVILTYSPEVIIIAGDYTGGSEKFIKRLKEKSAKRVFPSLDIKPNILLSKLGKSAGPIGSVSLVLKQMINLDNVWDN